MALNKPAASGRISDGATIGESGSTFALKPLRLRGQTRSGEVYDTTGDGDDANAIAVLPWKFWEKDFVFTGLLMGGKILNFANAGASDEGVAVTITFETGHTLVGNIVIHAIGFEFARKSTVTPLSFAGKGVGVWTESYTAP